MAVESIRERIARQMREEEEKAQARKEAQLAQLAEAEEKTIVKYKQLIARKAKRFEQVAAKEKAIEVANEAITKINELITKEDIEFHKYEAEVLELRGEEFVSQLSGGEASPVETTNIADVTPTTEAGFDSATNY